MNRKKIFISPRKRSASKLKKKITKTINNYDYKSNQIKLPNWKQYIEEIKDIVKDNWDLPNLGKSCLYNQDSSQDLFSESFVKSSQAITHIDIDDEFSKEKYISKRDLLELTTEFNTVYFFANVETRMKFLYLVISSFREVFIQIQQRLGLTRNNLNFILKGGIVFRLFIHELLRGFVRDVEDYILDQLGDKIKFSDFDFEIVSNRIDLVNFNKINIIAYLVILKIRNYLQDYNLLDFFQLDPRFQMVKLNKLKKTVMERIEELPDTNLYSGINVDRIEMSPEIGVGLLDGNRDDYQPFHSSKGIMNKKDFAIIVDAKESISAEENADLYEEEDEDLEDEELEDEELEEEEVDSKSKKITLIGADELFRLYGMKQKYVDLARKNNNLYATFNPLIKLDKTLEDGTVVDISFQLNRIKYNYLIFFQKDGEKYVDNIPGEVLDFSHAHLKDRKRIKFVEPFHRNILFTYYDFYQYKLSFLTYSHYGIITDLLEILFLEQDNRPWNNKKYKKRLYRLIYLTVFAYLSLPHAINTKESIIRARFTSPIEDPNLYTAKMKQLRKLVKLIAIRSESGEIPDLLLGQLLESIKETYQYKDEPEFEDFFQLTLKILQKVVLLIEINYQKANRFRLTDNPLSTAGLSGRT